MPCVGKALEGYCTLKKDLAECVSCERNYKTNKKKCSFCTNHSKGDTLYESNSWDGGISFDYINNIMFCPVCGTELEE